VPNLGVRIVLGQLIVSSVAFAIAVVLLYRRARLDA